MLIDHDTPQVLRSFYNYIETVRGKSPRTADEYYRDLRIFFRWLLWHRGLVAQDIDFNEISIASVGIDLLGSVELQEVYEYMHFLSRERPSQLSFSVASGAVTLHNTFRLFKHSGYSAVSFYCSHCKHVISPVESEQ